MYYCTFGFVTDITSYSIIDTIILPMREVHTLPTSVHVSEINSPILVIGIGTKAIFSLRDITVPFHVKSVIAINTLLLTLFIFMPTEWFNIVSILRILIYI